MKPRVVHVITGLDVGGAERSLFNLLQSGLQEHWDNHVVSLSGAGHYGPELERLNIPVFTIGMREGTGLWAAQRRLTEIVRSLRPNVIQGWMYHGNLAASLAGAVAARGAAVSWNIRQSLDGLEREKRATRLTIQLLRWFSASPRAIIYNSYRSREQHEARGYAVRPAIVIPNGFDTQKWRPDPTIRAEGRERLALRPDDVALGFVGRFHPIKDVPTFLRSCDIALDAVPALQVVMAGEGLDGQNQEIVSAIAPEKRARFHLLGRQGDVEKILPALDIFLSTSRNEGFPNVIGEAMASGLPCIATDVGDCARLLDGMGKIAPVGDVPRLADAVCEMANADLASRVKIGKASRDRIVTAYSIEATVDAYAKLYDSITKREA